MNSIDLFSKLVLDTVDFLFQVKHNSAMAGSLATDCPPTAKKGL